MIEPDKDAPGRYLDELASAAVKYFNKKPIPPDLPGVSEIKRLKSDAKGLADFLLHQPHIQQRLADVVDYTPNRWLLTQEIADICARRKIHSRPSIEFNGQTQDPYEWARKIGLQGICFSGGEFAAQRSIWEFCRALRNWGYWITLTTFRVFLVVVTFTNGLPPGLKGRNKSRNGRYLLQLQLQPTLRWDLERYRSGWSPYPPIKIVQPTQNRSAGFAAIVTISRLKKVCLPLTPGSPSPSGFAIRF